MGMRQWIQTDRLFDCKTSLLKSLKSRKSCAAPRQKRAFLMRKWKVLGIIIQNLNLLAGRSPPAEPRFAPYKNFCHPRFFERSESYNVYFLNSQSVALGEYFRGLRRSPPDTHEFHSYNNETFFGNFQTVCFLWSLFAKMKNGQYFLGQKFQFAFGIARYISWIIFLATNDGSLNWLLLKIRWIPELSCSY